MLASFQQSAIYFLEWNFERILRCLEELSEEEVWVRPNGNSNSVGNQILHLEGNIRQWAIHGLGGARDRRKRADEFATTDGWTKLELINHLSAAIAEAREVFSGLTVAEMGRERPVQAYVHDGTFILFHVIEHLSYHTGQIVFWTKALRDMDFDFYGGIALDQTGG